MPQARILVAEDEPAIRAQLKHAMAAEGFEVAVAGTAAAARLEFGQFRPDVCLLDYQLPDGTALELIESFKEVAPEVALIVLTGHSDVELAVATIKAGAEQFLTKPVELAALRAMVRRLVETRRSGRREVARLARDEARDPDPFVGTSPAVRRFEEAARAAADSDGTVLLLGETGSGKGVLARWIHAGSSRRREAFVDLNCGGLSREMLDSELFGHAKGAYTGALQAKQGLFEIADRGSFFLDEIGDIELSLQPKILKVVEEKRFRRLGEVNERGVDCRLITATHRDLAAAAEQGAFRADLYFRLNTFTIVLPTLRERLADLPVIVETLLGRLARETGLQATASEAAIAALARHSWPGNLRELRNLMEGILLRTRSTEITADQVRAQLGRPREAGVAPDPPTGAIPFEGSLEALERAYIEQVLRQTHGSVERSAERLGVPRSTLYQRLREFGLQPAQLRPGAPPRP